MAYSKKRNISLSRHVAGFNLIELMIVLAIIAFLSLIAYPGYQDYLIRAKRSEGRGLLLEIGNRMERMYSDCNAYPPTIAASGSSLCDKQLVIPSLSSEHDYYEVSSSTQMSTSTSGNGQTYLLKVTPKGWVDTDCGSLTLAHDGSRGVVTATGGSAAATDSCWGR